MGLTACRLEGASPPPGPSPHTLVMFTTLLKYASSSWQNTAPEANWDERHAGRRRGSVA
jgi:hypothetical protein